MLRLEIIEATNYTRVIIKTTINFYTVANPVALQLYPYSKTNHIKIAKSLLQWQNKTICLRRYVPCTVQNERPLTRYFNDRGSEIYSIREVVVHQHTDTFTVYFRSFSNWRMSIYDDGKGVNKRCGEKYFCRRRNRRRGRAGRPPMNISVDKNIDSNCTDRYGNRYVIALLYIIQNVVRSGRQ